MTNLDELKALLAAATPGEWSTPHFCDESIGCDCRYILSEQHMGCVCTIGLDNGKKTHEGGNDDPPLSEARANGKLIAALHNAAPGMIAEIEELRAEVAGFLEEIDRLNIGIKNLHATQKKLSGELLERNAERESRDARMKAEGAAEVIKRIDFMGERFNVYTWLDGEEAARLRQKEG